MERTAQEEVRGILDSIERNLQDQPDTSLEWNSKRRQWKVSQLEAQLDHAKANLAQGTRL